MKSTSPESAQYRQCLERARRCLDITVTHLTTITALLPTEEELELVNEIRSLEHIDLERDCAQLEDAVRALSRMARRFTDASRQAAGLDPQCCAWPDFDRNDSGSC